MTLKATLLKLLEEKPRTLEELASLTHHSIPAIKWHLLDLPVKVVNRNNTTYIFLVNKVDNSNPHDTHVVNQDDVNHTSWGELKPCSTPSISKSKQTYHGFSYQISKEEAPITKQKKNKTNHGLQHEVYNSDHGWLTSPLTLQDYALLDNLNHRQRVILKLLHQGKTQSQIARILKVTRQAIYKHVKKFLRWNFIKKAGSLWGNGSNHSVTYKVKNSIIAALKISTTRTCQPYNKGDVSSPHKPPSALHRLQLAFHIVNQSKPFTTSCSSFVKVYKPRGWTGYIYLIDNVRIRALPHKVIAEFTEDFEILENETAEQATIRAINILKSAIDQWLLEQSAYGVDIELSHPYIMNAPEFIIKSKLIKQVIEEIRQERKIKPLMQNGGTVGVELGQVYITDSKDMWIDDSDRDEEAHLETNNPDTFDALREGIRNALELPRYLNELNQVKQKVETIEAVAMGGNAIHTIVDTFKSYLTKLESRIDRLEQLILEGNGKHIREITQMLNVVATLMLRLDNLENKLRGEIIG